MSAATTGATRSQRSRGPGAAWVLTVLRRRALSQWPIVLVVFLVALLAGTMLASLATLVSASQRFALPEALTSATTAETDVNVDLEFGRRQSLATSETTTRTLVSSVFPGMSTVSRDQVFGDPLLLLRTAPHPAYLFPAALEGIEKHSKLVSGRWPAATTDKRSGNAVAEVALPVAAADGLKLGLGDHHVVYNETGEEKVVDLRVVGTFELLDTADAFWALDPLHAQGHDPALVVSYGPGQFTTDGYGPIVVEQGAFSAVDALSATRFRRTVSPSLRGVRAQDLAPLRGRLAMAKNDLASTYSDSRVTATLTTSLGTTLERADRLLYVTNTSVLVSSLILLVLTFAALLLATRLLAERRITDQTLMRARGASGGQLVRLTLIEAAVLAGLVVALAPPLARGVYRVMAQRPEFVAAGLDRDPGIPGSAWLAAAVAALLFVVVLVGPLLRPAGTFVDQEQARSRQDRRTVLQRSGLDLGLVVLAVVAYTQLRSYKSPLLSAPGGRLHVDPILVLGPALCLLAGSVLALRVVPAVSRLSEPMAAGGRSVVAALAAWELARRSKRATGAVLLITLTLAVGTFGLSYLSTWKSSQIDQADQEVAADARVKLTGTPLRQSTSVLGIAGLQAVTPVLARTGGAEVADDYSTYSAGTFGTQVHLIAAPAQRLETMLRGTALTDGRNNVLATLGPLAPESPAREGFALPGTPTQLSARVTLSRTPFKNPFSAALAVVVADRTGVRTVVELGTVPADGAAHLVTGNLVGTDSTGHDLGLAGARSAGGLSIISTQVFWFPDITGRGSFNGEGVEGVTLGVKVDDVRVRQAAAKRVPVQFGARRQWSGTPAVSSFGIYTGSGARDVTGTSNGPVLLEGSVHADTAVLGNGSGAAFVSWDPGAFLQVVASDSALAAMGAAVGEDIVMHVGTTDVAAVVSDRVPFVPGTDPHAPALLMDADSLSRAMLERGSRDPLLDEWWATVPDGGSDASVVSQAERAGGQATLREARGRELQSQPLRIAVQGALWLVVLAAAVLVAVGFAMHTAVAIRLRRTQFSQLRAIGVSRRQLTVAVVTENLLLVLLGTGFGIGLGVLTCRLVTPLVTLTAEGATPLPGVVVRIPWNGVGLLAGEVGVLLLLVLGVVSWSLRHQSLATALRQGDER